MIYSSLETAKTRALLMSKEHRTTTTVYVDECERFHVVIGVLSGSSRYTSLAQYRKGETL